MAVHPLVKVAKKHASSHGKTKRKFPRFTGRKKRKLERVFREGAAGTLHHGGSGKLVPKGRRDIVAAIAASEARRA